MEMIIFIGIQATGKSEFYKRNFYKTHIRVNLDMLRTRNREKILVNACIAAKQPLVIDNTNPTAADRAKYIRLAKEAGFSVTGYYFRSSIEEAKVRNSKREGKECLPLRALLATRKKLEFPTLEEGFDKLYYVSIPGKGNFHVEEYKDDF
jgi:predicted kinase